MSSVTCRWGERGASIDHVVVGPAGTFTLSAKDLTGKGVGRCPIGPAQRSSHESPCRRRRARRVTSPSSCRPSSAGRSRCEECSRSSPTSGRSTRNRPTCTSRARAASRTGCCGSLSRCRHTRSTRSPRRQARRRWGAPAPHATKMNPRRRRGFIRSGRFSPRSTRRSAVLLAVRTAQPRPIAVPMCQDRRVERLPTGDGIQSPEPGHPFQGSRTTVLEADPRPGHHVADGGRDQDLARLSEPGQPGRRVHGDPSEPPGQMLALTRVKPGPDLETRVGEPTR